MSNIQKSVTTNDLLMDDYSRHEFIIPPTQNWGQSYKIYSVDAYYHTDPLQTSFRKMNTQSKKERKIFRVQVMDCKNGCAMVQT